LPGIHIGVPESVQNAGTQERVFGTNIKRQRAAQIFDRNIRIRHGVLATAPAVTDAKAIMKLGVCGL